MSRQKGQGCSLVPSVIAAVFPPSPQLFPASGWSLPCLINLVTLLFNRGTPCPHTCGALNGHLMHVYCVAVMDCNGVARSMGAVPSHNFSVFPLCSTPIFLTLLSSFQVTCLSLCGPALLQVTASVTGFLLPIPKVSTLHPRQSLSPTCLPSPHLSFWTCWYLPCLTSLWSHSLLGGGVPGRYGSSQSTMALKGNLPG